LTTVRVGYIVEQNWHSVPGGTAVASLEVARRLTQRPGVDVRFVAGRHRRPPQAGLELPGPVNLLPFGRPLLYETWNRFGWPLVESVTGEIDVCHTPMAIPAASHAPSVVTVHDVAFVHHPERFTKRGVRVMNAGLKRCRRADLLLCPSETTRHDLVELGFDEDRLRLVPWGVDPIAATAAERDAIKTKYDLPDRFVLAVGTVEPRKNLPRLAAAVVAYNQSSHDDPLPLVVAGAAGWGDAEAIAHPKTLKWLGHVPHDLLPALYELATVFAYPSLEEGFGMPVLEAMAAGVPVVTSRGTATEQTAGGAAVLVDPHSVDDIAAGIATALSDRDQLVGRGRARAGQMSWETTVERTLDAYREVLA